jgi:hypothetical protein
MRGVTTRSPIFHPGKLKSRLAGTNEAVRVEGDPVARAARETVEDRQH